MSEKVFFHTAHKALWNWLSKNPEMTKDNWPGWGFNGGKVAHVKSSCFACGYFGLKLRADDCEVCPLLWGERHCSNGLYRDWEDAMGIEQYEVVSKLAAQIRDLPVREGVVCK